MSINKLCRLCALQCETHVNIYENEYTNMELETKISSCLQISVSSTDILPRIVCRICCAKLNESYDFFQKSNKAQSLLQQIYEMQSENCKSEELDCTNAENVQCEPAKSNDNMKVEIREAYIQENSTSKLELNLVDMNAKVPSYQDTKQSNLVRTDDGDCTERIGFFDEVMKKLHHREKDLSLNDVPANPRLTQLLQGYLWPCTICEDKVMNNLQDLQEHYKMEHQQPPVFKCITCEKQYDRYRSFARHIKMHQNPKRYICDICGKSFAQKAVLQSHATVHTDERPHVCYTCGKSFKNFSSLYVHGKIHLLDQVKEQYCCDCCQKKFSTRHTLETHKKIHTGERNFVCDICGKSFIAKGSLDYHLLSHTGDKNHICSTCGKAFKTARLLGKHVSLHTGIKPHQCDVCGKQFRERSALREHTRIHTGAMPYSCEFCGKCFRFKGILTVHRRQHTGERPYACLDCRRYFTNWANYNKHMKRIHQCDMSNSQNSRQYSTANNIQVDTADAESSNSIIVTDDKTNDHYIHRHSALQITSTKVI